MMIDMALKEMETTDKSIKEEFKTLGIASSESTVQRNADLNL